MTLLDLALEAQHVGLCVLPPEENGTKRPLAEHVPAACHHPDCVKVRENGNRLSWKHWQHTAVDEDTIRRWYDGNRTGIGLVCGGISGGLEMFEFEGRAMAEGIGEEFDRLAAAAGIDDLIARIAAGYMERTPSGGAHLLYRCSEVGGNLKLARRPATDVELADDPNDRVKVLLETRGEGGFTICAPSGGRVHPDGGCWELVSGSVAQIVTITPEERHALHTLAAQFDRMPNKAPGGRPVRPLPERDAEGAPGEDFNRRATWAEILEPHGWKVVGDQGDALYWCRPGKDRGISASTDHNGNGYLWVFSSSTPFDTERAYSKFAALTVLTQGDDSAAAFSAAAGQLRRDGYGAPRLQVVRERHDGDPGPTPPPDLEADHPADPPATGPPAGSSATPAHDETGADPLREIVQIHSHRVVSGVEFVLSTPETPESIWGEDDDVLWPRGEPFFVVGPSGVGKSTLVQQTVKARLGDGAKVLGWPVQPTTSRVLYLAMDRPLQIARSLRRMFGPGDTTLLERLTVWKGPLPFNLIKSPEALVTMADELGCDTIVVDSLKDLAARISDEEVGAQINAAFQHCIAADVQVEAIHHQRKAQGDNKKPSTLSDVYGSQMLINGAGSVILLWGQAGDPVVQLTHLKQPVETIGPLTVTHDHTSGITTADTKPDVYDIVHGSSRGVDAALVASILYDKSPADRADTEKARRKLDRLVERGFARRVDGDNNRPSMWYPTTKRGMAP